MAERKLILGTIACAYADIAIFSSFYAIISSAENGSFSCPFTPFWLLCSGLCIAFLFLLSRRSLDSSAAIKTEALFLCIQAALTFIFCGHIGSFVGTSAVIFLWGISYYRIYQSFFDGVKPERLTDLFDACAAALIFAAFTAVIKEDSFRAIIHLPAAMALLLFALSFSRSSHGALPAVSVLLPAAGAFAVVKFGSGAIRKAADLLMGALRLILSVIAGIIRAIFLFLASLLPEEEYSPVSSEASEALPSLELAEDDVFSNDALLRIIIILCAAAAGIFIIYRILHSVKFKRISASSGPRKTVGRKSAGRHISEIVGSFFKRLRYVYCALAFRNSCRGMLAWINAFGMKGNGRRRENESCRDFLLRVSEKYPDCKKELAELAVALDEEFFSLDSSSYGKTQAENLRS